MFDLIFFLKFKWQKLNIITNIIVDLDIQY